MSGEPDGSQDAMTGGATRLTALLAAALAHCPRAAAGSRVEKLKRLSGGANMETWSLDWLTGEARIPLILRRLPAGGPAAEPNDAVEPLQVGTIDLATEATIIGLAASHGVRVPTVVLVLEPEHGLGSGYLMSRERGEALPNRILADERFSAAREVLAFQCGETLGRIHQLPLAQLPPGLRNLPMEADLDRLQALLGTYGNASPVHQLGLNWLRQHRPDEGPRCLVHGDFRNGNLLVDERGLSAVLDWELAHIGYPAEDLGYICGNVWRFGRPDKPVGGFGEYEDLLAGYRSVTGSAPDLAELLYWQVYCALGWGLVCLTMVNMYRSGQDSSLERAAVGRRMSESEIDLLLLLEEVGA
jgi:aminoglycoside phosphotransferase (APT) family kinase protein